MIYEPEKDSFLLSKTLREILPNLLRKKPNLTFLEIGAGSGIQLQTAIETGIKKENIFAADINPAAVNHCKKRGFNCIKSNLFEKIVGKFDIIIFNPPYLPEDEKEPTDSKLATTGGKQGGEIVNKFLKSAKSHLNHQGMILLLVSDLTKGINFKKIKLKVLAKEKIFFEELKVLEIKYDKTNSLEKKIS
ncbi:methyltransferase [archaeon]|jgi:release factor glutamine methyltransferase|nr:methyltransferase [archaeon]